MSIDDTATTPASPEAPFCPGCGQRTAAGDRFCRRCGHSLAPSTASDAGSEVSGPRRGRRTGFLVAALTALAAAAAMTVLVLSGAFASETTDEDSAAQRRLATQRARLKPMFDELMRERDAFLGQERRYLVAMSDARDTIADYRRDERDYEDEFDRIDEEFADEFDQCYRFDAIPCPEPDYPDVPKVPGFSKQTKQLRGVAVKLEELRAGLASIEPKAELRVVHTQLLACVDALKQEGSHNADVLDEAAEPTEGEAIGSLDKGKLRTLRRDSALPAIRQLNRAAVTVVDRFSLRRLDYDLPGGRDLDAADHSDEI